MAVREEEVSQWFSGGGEEARDALLLITHDLSTIYDDYLERYRQLSLGQELWVCVYLVGWF